MAKQRINRRRLLFLSAAFFVFCVLAGGLYAYRVHRIHSSFMTLRAKGMSASESGRHAQAMNLLGEYLARYPSDQDALSAYAKNCQLVDLPNEERLPKAIWALRRVLQAEPGRLDARDQLMELYLTLGYHAEALDEADKVLTARIGGASEPGTALDLTALGLQPMASIDPSANTAPAPVVKKLLASLRQFPDAMKAIGIRTEAMASLRNYSDALATCNWWIAADPANLDAALIRVKLMQDNRHSEEEANHVNADWIQKHSVTSDADLLTGHTALVYGQIAQARVALEKAATVNPGTAISVRILISDLDSAREPELARMVVVRSLLSDPTNDSLRNDLIRRDWDAGYLDDVVKVSSDISADQTLPTFVLALRTTALLMLGKEADSRKSLDLLKARKADREAAAWVILIDQSIDHRPDLLQILNTCQPALEQNPHDYYLRHFMAETYAQLGERELAIHEWQRVTNEDLSWALPSIRLSKTLLETGRPDQARLVAFDAYNRSLHSAEGAITLAEAWTADIQAGHTEHSDECVNFVASLCKALPHDGRPQVLQAALFAALNRTSQSIEVVENALAAPDALPEQSWIRMAALSEASKSHLEQRCLERSQKEHGITPALAYAKAVAAGDPKAGIASFDADAQAASQQQGSTQSSPAIVADHSSDSLLGWDLARAGYLELVHDKNALQAWANLADHNPKLVRMQRLVLSVNSARADQDLSSRCIDRLGSLIGRQDPSWRAARARWLVDFAPFLTADNHPTPAANEARNLLNELILQAPDSAEYRLLSAQAFERADQIPDAISDLRVASNLSPGVVSLHLYLARLLNMEGDFDASQEQLAGLTDKDLVGSEQVRAVAAMLAQQGQIDRAIEMLEEDARAGKEAGTASLLLAQLYQRHGEYSKAEDVFKKLLENSPDPATLRAAAELYAIQGEMNKAHATLDQLGRYGKTEPGVVELTKADFALRFETSYTADQTISLFESATKAGPTNPLTWRALVAANLLLNRPTDAIVAAQAGLKANPSDTALSEIAREPAMLTYAVGDKELRPVLLSFVKDPSGASAAANTLRTVYSSLIVSQQQLSELAKSLKDLSVQYPRFVPLQVYLIHFYEKLNRFDDAVTVALAAARALPESPEIAQATTEALLGAGRNAEALLAAKNWAAKVPAQRTPATLLAVDALLNLKQPVDAINLLKPLVDAYSAGGDPAALQQISQKYVEAQTAAGTVPDLATLMKPLRARGPRGRLAWMEFAVRNLPPAEAEAWLQVASSEMPPPSNPDAILERVGLCEMYSALGAKNADPRYARIAHQIIDPLASMDKPAFSVLLESGKRFTLDENWPAAAASYTRALALQPKNPMVQNNLAMDLARTGKPLDALPLIDAAINTKPDYSEYFDTRAFVRLTANDIDGAIADTRQSIRLDPITPRFRIKLIRMLANAQHRKEAIEELKNLDAILRDPRVLSPQQTQELSDLRRLLAVPALAGGT